MRVAAAIAGLVLVAVLSPGGRHDARPVQLLGLRVTNGGAPFAGDGPLLTTVTPNGDGLRDAAEIHLRLAEPATVRLDVQRTSAVPSIVATQMWSLRAGAHTLRWAPPRGLAPRTYVLALTTIDQAGTRLTYGSPSAFVDRYPRAPVVRLQGVDAAFARPSYAPGDSALLKIATDAAELELQVFRTGPERSTTRTDDSLAGVAAGAPRRVRWTQRDRPGELRVAIGDWPSGLYFVRLTAGDGRVGFAPFVLRPARLGGARVAVVLPTNTWQAYNFQDADGDGWGETWYTGPPHRRVVLGRPYLHRGVPPFFYRYDQGFLHWFSWTGKRADFLAESDLAAVSGDELAAAYTLIVYPGHTEYVTEHEYDAIERYRDLGGNLIFLSANNFFWRVAGRGPALVRTGKWRDLGRPEAGLIGVQYRASDRGQRQGVFVRGRAAPWLWPGTGLGAHSGFGRPVGGYGIEIDHTSPASPRGTRVLAEIRDLFGAGVTAQMTYYETGAGAKVFAAGALDFGGSATTWPVRQMLENLWARLAAP
jgi:hypothetical protein